MSREETMMFGVVDGRCVECGVWEVAGAPSLRHRDGCLAFWGEVHGIAGTTPRADRCVCDAPEGATAVAHIDRGCTVGRPFFCTVLIQEDIECGGPAVEAERVLGSLIGRCRTHSHAAAEMHAA